METDSNLHFTMPQSHDIVAIGPDTYAPCTRAEEVTLSDSVDITLGWCRQFYVGVSGDIKLTTVYGDTVTLVGVPIGMHVLAVNRFWSTGTTATDIVAFQ